MLAGESQQQIFSCTRADEGNRASKGVDTQGAQEIVMNTIANYAGLDSEWGQFDPEDLKKFITQVAERLATLTTEKQERCYRLWQMMKDANSSEDRSEIASAILEIAHPALIDLPWKPGAVGDMNEGVSKESLKKLVSYRKKLGARVKTRREKLGLTQVQLAEKSKLPQSHISRIEKGKHASTDITIQRLADALDTSPGKLDPASPD